MKSQFARIKNRAKGASTRTLAVMLCFVMLLTAIGSGTVLSAIAAGTASDSTAVADAAQKFADIAGQVDTDAAADDKVAAEDDETSFIMALAKKTKELAETGKKAELSESGDSQTYTVYFDNSVLNWSNIYVYSGSNMSISGKVLNPGTATQMTTHNGDIYSISMTVNNGKIAFSDVSMSGWNDFYGNNAVWSDTITSTNCLITPDTGNTWKNNNTNYTFGNASDPNAVTATATRTWYRNDGTGRKNSGDGTVKVNSQTANADSCTDTVSSGSTVTFTATPTNSCTFGGWYSDANCTTLVSPNATYTTAVSADQTLYAAFNKPNYYLVGKFYLADQAKEIVAASTETGYQFTQSSTNPAEYTYQNDFMFKYNTGEGSYHLQYVTVGSAHATKAYVASTAGAASGTAASDWNTLDNGVNGSNKWTCGDSINATYPSSNLNNCYKHVTFTWNAINETLSWTTTDIDETQYTKIYVHGGTYKYEHMWLGNNAGSLTSNGQLLGLIGTPYIEVNGTAYNVVLVKNATVGANGLYTQLYENNDTSSIHTNDLGPMTAGSSYTLDGTAATVALVDGAPTAATSSSSWKNTDTHADASPEQTGSSSYYFVWADNDNGPGKAGTTAISAKNGGSEYWADITTYCKNNSNFYFALSDNTNNSGIRGNKSEQINGVTKSAGNTVTMTNGSGSTIFYVEMKELSSVTGSAYFQHVRGVDWTKISAIGVSAYYSGSGAVNYKYYYKEVGSTDEQVTSVTVYAKDGAAPIDWDNKGSGGASATSGTAYNYAAIATTAISQIDGATPASGVVSTVNVGDASSQYQTATVDAGKSIQITTTIANTSPWRTKYYVRGWCINGVTYTTDGNPGINTTVNSDGVYTMTYTIPAEPEVDYLEITPIYYISSTWASTNSVTLLTFYVEGYNTIQSKWGNTPYVYPFYGNLNNVENSFGVYPGQPMVYVEGKYSTEIPMTSTTIMAQTSNGIAIKGITVNNGYADYVHRNLIYMWTDHDNDAAHKQTYDYDDFYKIYNECLTDAAGNPAGHPNSIIFRIQDEETTYNRSAYGGGKSGQFANGTDDINISAIASSGNGWELLTNRYDQAINLFGSTSGITKPSSGTDPENDTSNALYVVSTGYNANIAGDYGTMWKIYDGEGKLISTDATNGRYGVPPSILLLRGSASGYNSAVAGVGYPAASHSVDGVGTYTDNISKYETIYKALKAAYTDKRVYITYEKDTQDTRDDSSGTGAYRLDGRWYYTHKTDTVQSTVGIEYWDNSTGAWVTDTVSASTGDGTSGGTNKNNVVFDSGSRLSDSQKTTSSSKVISAGGTWNFTATAGTGYMFDSWQIKYSDTSYDQITGAGASASIGATANYTLVARFVPIVTGSLTIDHTLSGSSTGEGTVDMEVKVYTTNAKASQVGSTLIGSHVYLDGTYISNSLSDYYIEVQLKTTPLYDGTVDAFGYDKFNTDNSISATEAKSATPATSTFGFTVGDLYAGTTLATSSLAYTSTIIETPHYYNFTYSFTTRDNQSKTYTSRGVISLKDYKAYVGDNHTMDTSYVTAKAPFESNFLKTTTLTPTAPTYTSDTHTFSGTYTFTNDAATPLHHVIVKLPYDYYTSGIPSGSKKYSASSTAYNASKATFDLAANYNEFLTIDATSTVPGSQSKVSKVTDATDTNHTGNDFITAPDELTNSGTTMYFAYWDIKQLKADGVTPSESVAKLYYPDFHYRIYSNYYVEAVYTATAANSWKMKYSDDENNIGANIIYLGDSRNQWNNGSASSGSSSDSATDAADRIYSDFIFNYADKGAELKGSDREIGMVIERVIYTEDGTSKWATGSANVTDMYSYKTTYDDTEAAMASDIKNALQNATAMPTGCIKQAWSTSDLNNKNFMEQNYNVYSAYGQTVSESGEITYKTDNTIDNYVYRAYAYIKASDGKYYLSEPAYFCMRYTANRKFS